MTTKNVSSGVIHRPVLVTFIIAAILRIAASVAIRALKGGVLFLDDRAYLTLAQNYARGGREALSASQNATWSALRSFLFPLGWVGDLVTSDPLAFSLMTALAGSLVAAGVAWLVRQRLGDRFALVAGLAVAMMPSQVLWSSLILRDAYSWLALVVIALLLGAGGTLPRRLAAWVAVPLVLVYLDGIRGHTFIVASTATAAALIFHFRRHVVTIGLTVVALAAIALVSGTAERITSVMETGTSGRQEELSAAVDAGKTTIACVVVPFVYEAPSDGVGWSGDLQCLPSGLRMMLLDPFPNQLGKSVSLVPPFLENLVWYPLLFLAARGIRRLHGWRTQDVFVLASAVGTLCVWALVDRNFGTGFRHRGEFFWAVAYFAAFGLHHTLVMRSPRTGSVSARIRARLVPDERPC